MRVIRSAGQNVSPSDDGRLFDQAFSDGLFEDATIAANGGNSIAIGALYGIICGRDFTAEAQTIAATLPESDTATGYVYVEIDTSSDDIITIGTALAPFTPTYEDINTNGAVVQMIIAQYEASAVAVTSVTPTYTTASAGAVDAGSVATIETSPTVAAHAVGDIILYGGKIYEVTAAISIGESLVIGTNIVATSIGDEISSLNAGLTLKQGACMLNSAALNHGGGKVYKYGRVCIVNLEVNPKVTGIGLILASVPNDPEFKPLDDDIHIMQTNYNGTKVDIYLKQNGDFMFNIPNASVNQDYKIAGVYISAI